MYENTHALQQLQPCHLLFVLFVLGSIFVADLWNRLLVLSHEVPVLSLIDGNAIVILDTVGLALYCPLLFLGDGNLEEVPELVLHRGETA
jgi:hypothetical protein